MVGALASSGAAGLLLQPANVNDGLDAARQSLLYSHLDHPKQAAKLTCLDTRRLKLNSSNGGLRIFNHKSRPTVYAHIMARVVGIEEKEKKVIWLVDDGSAIIAVHHYYQQSSRPERPQDRQQAWSSRKGKERQMDNETGGIPSEYLLPPPPPLHNGGKGKVGALINVADVYEIGQLVSIVGRVELWIDRKERVIFVDKVISAKMKQDRSEHEGSIQMVKDPNQEPQHLLSALHLSATEYSKKYDPPEDVMTRISEWVPIKLREISSATRNKIEETAKMKRATVRGNEETRKLRVMEDVTESSTNGARKRALDMVRRPERNSKQEERLERRAKKQKEEVKVDASISQAVDFSEKIASPVGRPRQLRNYMKLSDSKMNESTFRVYVEKHIVDLCSSGDSAVPSPFTLGYLLHVPDLRGHAKRTVEVASRRREEKRRRLQESKTGKASNKVTVSNEDISDKMKRLYASVLQALLLDGIIVLAPPTTEIKPAFHGPSEKKTESHRPTIQEDAYQVVVLALLAIPILEILSNSPSPNLNSVQLVEKLRATDERWRYIRCESVQEGMQFLLKGAAM